MYTYIYTQTPYIYINTFKHHSSHSRGYQKALLGITGNNTRFHHVMIGILLFLYSALFLCLFSLFMLLSEFFNFIILLGCFLAGFFFLLSLEDINQLVTQTFLSRSGMSTTQQKRDRFIFSVSINLC